ncbi:BTAD domain-containing putative transcriptional regulator [Streptomyces sp. ADI93-02]|uniref:ATP-binding protein n=1 Tax=Streptomyces sp. ADI93-02 TaxID=1522757 RepID=UPI000F98A234|nr:BTAD domain-containing putative transcriptional regulator [Streptomyces sp. ADI93-02]RPK46621.1 putative HTH-type transcriptional regulator [Streptomyces sp. ADI93-02]
MTQLGGGYRLDVDVTDVDALRFEQRAAAGRDRLRSGDPDAAAVLLGEAVDLWGDRPGAEPAVIAPVAPAAAIRLAHVSVEAVADLAEAELALGRADAATSRLTALLAERPVHERAAALLMDALAAQGRQAEALARYERFRETLADTLGADPGAALRERHLRLPRAERPTPAADAVEREERGNLPAPLTSFIGREDDLARIDTLLATGRLVTVLGPGGAGKTRLAVEAARRHRQAYRDGAWLIDLAHVTDPAKAGGALLVAIGLRGSALFEAPARLRSDPVGELDVLADQLNGRESLLVVDNCEHLIDAVAHLVPALLARCAGLRVLATSRHPLAVDGEALVPLPLPEPDAELQQARRTPSVRLFTERAAAVRPGFGVDEQNLGEVLRIVHSLDGLPLAPELAAARLRTLSLAGLAAGLSDRFRLLATGSRTAFPRHRTLRAGAGLALPRTRRRAGGRGGAAPGVRGGARQQGPAGRRDGGGDRGRARRPVRAPPRRGARTRRGGPAARRARPYRSADPCPEPSRPDRARRRRLRRGVRGRPGPGRGGGPAADLLCRGSRSAVEPDRPQDRSQPRRALRCAPARAGASAPDGSRGGPAGRRPPGPGCTSGPAAPLPRSGRRPG